MCKLANNEDKRRKTTILKQTLWLSSCYPLNCWYNALHKVVDLTLACELSPWRISPWHSSSVEYSKSTPSETLVVFFQKFKMWCDQIQNENVKNKNEIKYVRVNIGIFALFSFKCTSKWLSHHMFCLCFFNIPHLL